MSDRSVEDELISETRKFAASISSTMQRYTQASNWLERRKVRKEIQQAWRKELKQQALDRTHQLTWTAQGIESFRHHSAAVSARADDPSVDHDRRHRDTQALARRRNEMAEQILRNPHLTQVEQGIALDGLDAASVFPEFATGNLFGRAHKVKGIEALRYRAQVARVREAAGLERPAVVAQRVRAAQASTFGDPERSGQPGRVAAERAVGAMSSPVEPVTPSRAKAVQGLRRAQMEWNAQSEGATAQGRDYQAEKWRDAARTAERAGLTPAQIESEFANAEANSRYVAQVWSLDHPDGAWRRSYSHHPSEADAAAWMNQHVRESAWAQGAQLFADVHERGNHDAPLRTARGGPEHVAARAAMWTSTESHATNTSTREAAPTVDRDREFSALKDRHRLSIQYNNALVEQNSKLVKQAAAVSIERDQLLAQRDEAVRKLAERTPAEQRYGSPERQAAQAQAGQSQQAADRATMPPTSESSQRHERVKREAGQLLAKSMLSAADDKDSTLVQGKLQDLAQRHGADRHAYASEFTNWWVYEGGGRSYQQEKAGRESAARTTTDGPDSGRSASSRSALSDYQSGNALADAVARSAERNGAERNGAER
ncbi:hypothetical protein [Nocardia sp. NPDC051463]|uniref:hypothetical protein n=1 Tax=Nocardia sp. NPDC051463 TaxID=3154845 RepID=UPI00344C6931